MINYPDYYHQIELNRGSISILTEGLWKPGACVVGCGY
jgi:hypothetical protein